MRNVILLGGLLCFATGCGGGAAITGKVTLDDGSAAPRGAVMLRNESATFQGAIESDGTYTIENVAPGEYQVAVIGVVDREQTDSDAGMQWDQEAGQYVGSTETEVPKPLIEAKYANPQTSGLTISVPGDDYNLTVDRVGGSGTPAGDSSETPTGDSSETPPGDSSSE